MMIKITRIPSTDIIEEYISSDEIVSCYKKKVVDKKPSVKCISTIISFEKQIELNKIEENTYYSLYKDRDDNIYGFRNYYDDYKWDEKHNDTELIPGWNRIEKVPEEYHYEYFIEKRSNNKISGKFVKSIWDGRTYSVNMSSKDEIIQITEESYNNINEAII